MKEDDLKTLIEISKDGTTWSSNTKVCRMKLRKGETSISQGDKAKAATPTTSLMQTTSKVKGASCSKRQSRIKRYAALSE